ncbi:testis-expressed protein 36 [Notolabrus celidotus]|uniref:testis-expressed protein 36 n=1 Tax=Notolabrus celidotus TaxID=1203425 RepID=UPI00148F8013|nr:testis-expressed protein 36 [Notolabrus celidotus]
MVKGGKRHSSVSNDGKWFAHPALPENVPQNRETCTSTGIMLSQAKSPLPQALNSQRFPKWKTQQASREFQYSDHDNKHALKDDISVFTQGVGRRKCPDERKETNSHFCLCHDGSESSTKATEKKVTIYKTDFMEKKGDNGPTSNRRFPRNHKQKSAEAALAQAEDAFMWFGRDETGPLETLQVLGKTNHSAPFKL